MSARRHDPGRRDRIIDVTLELIAEVGVAGLSHRRIAARADVPLGSMTYHFAGMDDLLQEAFSRFAERIAASFADHLAGAQTPDDAAVSVVHLIADLSDSAAIRDTVITYELYTLAARDPRFREITTRWMARSREELARHFDPEATRQIDALIEGLTIHRALDIAPVDLGIVESAVRRILGA